MYEIYLTEASADSAHPKRVAEILVVEGPAEASAWVDTDGRAVYVDA